MLLTTVNNKHKGYKIKTLIITKFDEDNELKDPLKNLPQIDFNTIINNNGYDVHKLLQGAIDNDRDAKEYLEELVHHTNTSSNPIPFQIVRHTYIMDSITVVHAAFLTANDIDFITESLYGKCNVIFASIKDTKVLLVNPYNANYYVYDSFSKLPLNEILNLLLEEPSTPFSTLKGYKQITENTILKIK